MKRRNASIFLPPAQVVVMIALIAVMLGAVFGLMMGSAMGGGVVGLAAAGAVYGFIVVDARGKVKKRHARR